MYTELHHISLKGHMPVTTESHGSAISPFFWEAITGSTKLKTKVCHLPCEALPKLLPEHCVHHRLTVIYRGCFSHLPIPILLDP